MAEEDNIKEFECSVCGSIATTDMKECAECLENFEQRIEDYVREILCPSCGARATTDMKECPECKENFERITDFQRLNKDDDGTNQEMNSKANDILKILGEAKNYLEIGKVVAPAVGETGKEVVGIIADALKPIFEDYYVDGWLPYKARCYKKMLDELIKNDFSREEALDIMKKHFFRRKPISFSPTFNKNLQTSGDSVQSGTNSTLDGIRNFFSRESE